MKQKLLLSVVGMTLLLGVFAGPATALDPAPSRVLLINGLPARVDICFGRTEAVSNLRYGRAVLWEELPPGAYRFVIRAARVGRCTGSRLGIVTRTIGEGGNYSLVIWRPNRVLRIRQFENTTAVPADKSTITMRHVARGPSQIDVWLWEHVKVAATDDGPTIDNLRRGASSPPIAVRPGQYYVDSYPARRTRRFGWEGYWGVTEVGLAVELYQIGTTKRNSRIVAFAQPGVLP